jgi:hypothetical protein
MATRYDGWPRNDQQAQSMMNNFDLSAPEIHDFSDLRLADGQKGHMLRWVIAIAAVLTVGHFMFNAAGIAPRTEVSSNAASTSTSM